MKQNRGLLATAALLGFMAAPLAAANSKSETGATIITSGRLKYDYKRSIAIFENDVVVQDPQVRIESDTLTVLFGKTNEIRSATALGNVRIRSGDKTARCRKAIYIARTGEILLTGDAELHREKDSLAGDQITFWLHEERVFCKPGRLVFYPNGKRSSENVLEEHIRGGPRDAADD